MPELRQLGFEFVVIDDQKQPLEQDFEPLTNEVKDNKLVALLLA